MNENENNIRFNSINNDDDKNSLIISVGGWIFDQRRYLRAQIFIVYTINNTPPNTGKYSSVCSTDEIKLRIELTD